MPTRRHLTFLFPIALLLAVPSRARADTDAAPPALRQEIVGLEAHGLSMAQGDGVSPRPAIGIGGLLRFGRHRWPTGYVTPFQAGVFVAGSDEEVISVRVLTEVGWVLHGELGVLELGLGAGAGILGIKYGENRCDGSCNIGGKGVLLSPVVRYLFRETGHFPIGVVLRGEVPIFEPSGEGFGYFTGWGTQVLLGLDVGAGL